MTSLVKTNNQFRIKQNDRVFLAGKTGSGKSTLARYLLMNVKRLIVIDSKNGIDNDEWFLTDYKKADLRKIRSDDEAYRIRLVDNDTDIIEVCNVAYTTGNNNIYIDEITALIPQQSKAPSIFLDIWTRGRSRNMGAWSGTQRPVYIPRFFLTETENFFCFRLGSLDDRKRLAEYMGKQVLTPTVDKFGFYYYNGEMDSVKYFKQLNIKG